MVEVRGYVVKVADEAYLGGHPAAAARGGSEYVRHRDYRSAYALSTQSFLVRLTAEDGTVGWGEAQAPLVPEAAAVLVERLLGPFLLGQDVEDTAVHWSNAYDAMRERGHGGGFYLDAIAACDIALWDLKGRLLDRPVSTLLGGRFRECVPCYVSGLPGEDAGARAALAVRWRDEGFDAFKLALGGGADADLEVFRAVREAVGSAPTIHVDAHWRYSPAEAIGLGRRFEALGLGFLEAPVAPEDLAGQAEVSRALDAPVAVGEELRTRYAFVELLTRRAADVVQPDVGRMGISEAVVVAALAEAFHVPVALHLGVGLGVYIAASLQVAAAIPNHLTTEYQPQQFRIANRMLREPLVCREGLYLLPEGSGLGVTVDEDRLLASASATFHLTE